MMKHLSSTYKIHLLKNLKLTILILLLFSVSKLSANIYNVNTTNDTHALNPGDGSGSDGSNISLRAALEDIEVLGGSHTINLPAGIYLLTEGTIYFGSSSMTVTIQGAGSSVSIIRMDAGPLQDRIFMINPFGDAADVSVTINDIKFLDGHLNTDPYGGGAIRAGGPNNLLSINNCVFENNTIDPLNAGTTGGAINYSGGGTLSISNSTFDSNSLTDSDGGAVYYFLQNFPGLTGSISITNSLFNNNSIDGLGGGNGGAIGFSAAGADINQSFSVSIKENSFTNNSAQTGTGGAIFANTTFGATGTFNINHNRFVGNSAAIPATSGLAMFSGAGDLDARNNWWGCNDGPTGSSLCDQAAVVNIDGSGILIPGPWLQLKASADPDLFCGASTNNTSTITAGFLSNSDDDVIAVSDLDALIGLPISFSATGGTLSGAQPVIQSSGTATVLFTSDGVSPIATVNAVVDNVPVTDPDARATISSDQTAPTLVCPLPARVQCPGDVPAPDVSSVTATDDSGEPVTVTWVDDIISNQTCPNRYTITRTYQGTDACGNSSTCTQIINVFDNTAPTITCPQALSVSCQGEVPQPDPSGVTASDNCPGIVTVTWVEDIVSNQTCPNRYTISRVYRATDVCGNEVTCTQEITVNDQTAPAMACPATVTVQCASDVPARDFAGGTVSDNCGGPVSVVWVTDVISDQTCNNRYTITRTYKATDDCNNETTCTQTIIVNDQTPPVLTAGPINSCYQSLAEAEAAALAATNATDNCGGNVVKTVSSIGGCSATITVTGTDDCGNVNNTVFTTRIDFTPPTAVAGSIGSCYQSAAAAEAAAIAATTATDNCPGPLTMTAATTGDCNANIIVTVSDACGNSSFVTYATRIDNTPPVIVAGTIANCYQTAADAMNAAINATTATDNCGGPVTKTATVTGTCAATVTVTATDGCGNNSSTTYSTRIDNTAPVLTCPNVEANATSPSGAIVNYDPPTATDNCGGVTVAYVSGGAPGSNFPIGVTNVTWSATDACGNSSTCTFTVTVNNPSCGPNKVYVCHNGNTICININALAAHLNHGDQYGPCSWYIVGRANAGEQPGEDVYVEEEEVTVTQEKAGKTLIQPAPATYKLVNYPNPFSNKTMIRFELPVDARVSIILYDILGRPVADLVQGEKNAGVHYREYDATALAPGIYYCRFVALAGGTQYLKTEKLSIIR